MESFYELLDRIPGTLFDTTEGSRIETLFELFSENFDEHLEVVRDLENLKEIDTRTGAVLDEIGKILKEPRMGRSDEEYRSVLYIAIQRNISGGSLQTVAQITENLSGNADYSIRELHAAAGDTMFDETRPLNGQRLLNPGTAEPAAFEIIFSGETGGIDSDLYKRIINEIKSAGVDAEISVNA
jgi:hypothetical protein